MLNGLTDLIPRRLLRIAVLLLGLPPTAWLCYQIAIQPYKPHANLTILQAFLVVGAMVAAAIALGAFLAVSGERYGYRSAAARRQSAVRQERRYQARLNRRIRRYQTEWNEEPPFCPLCNNVLTERPKSTYMYCRTCRQSVDTYTIAAVIEQQNREADAALERLGIDL